MANDNQNQVLDEHTEVIDDQKSAVKRVRKTKPKASESGTTASLFGIAPYQPKKNEEYMSEGQLEHFRQILNAWTAELMSEVDRTLNTMQDESSALPDVNDRATQEEEFAIELRTRDRERKLLKKIEQSIARIDAGDYGYCDETGEPIGVGRLIARPTATLSLEAQQRRELKQKMFGD